MFIISIKNIILVHKYRCIRFTIFNSKSFYKPSSVLYPYRDLSFNKLEENVPDLSGPSNLEYM